LDRAEGLVAKKQVQNRSQRLREGWRTDSAQGEVGGAFAPA
jgi:hypothetical protein